MSSANRSEPAERQRRLDEFARAAMQSLLGATAPRTPTGDGWARGRSSRTLREAGEDSC